MAIAVFSCLLAFSVIMGVMHCLTDYSNDWKSVASKTFFVVSTLLLALVSANLASSYGALTLMISIGLALLIVSQTLQCTNAQQQTKATFFTARLIQMVALLLFAFAGISLFSFVPWGILTGLCAGIALTFLIAILQRDKSFVQYLFIFLSVTCSLIFLFQSFACLFLSKYTFTSILLLVGAIFLCARIVVSVFSNKDSKLGRILSDVFLAISLICIASSIFVQ